jgi:single-strand selective monofunctional uracil DNA glycosylase
VGVGAFAEKRARMVLGDAVSIGQILHPSPASPRANRGWAGAAETDLAALGVHCTSASK